ncbi:hypothetical protein EKD04_005785 [Chloroflexales bacterium ZM16-3]|nr:hypothetical protein [Chloroflexales bacterium ZM16-3]
MAQRARDVLLIIAPLAWVESVRWLSGAPPDAGVLWRGLFVAGSLAAAWAGSPRPATGRSWRWPWPTAGVGAVGTLAALWYVLTAATPATWAMVASGYVALLWATQVAAADLPRRLRPALPLGIALLAGLAVAAMGQVEARFSDEEFFVSIQAAALAGLWWWLWQAWHSLGRLVPPPALPARDLALPRPRYTAPPLALAVALAAALCWRAYLGSFFPAQAPAYTDITTDEPFLCGSVPESGQVYNGRAVFQHLIDLLAQHPQKGAPEYGMLALSTGDTEWAQQFRTQLLAEAAAALFAGPANSVKYIQYEASGRVYYYDRVRSTFPGLFSTEDDAKVRAWFAAVNRRALTVEWIDWTYSLALGDWPEGPYANQESGAGLLALLNSTGLADPALTGRNQDYLRRHPGGWDVRFRNTDDAVIYQPEWINNAYYQHLAGGGAQPEQVRRSIEWLLVQALPDGMPLQYNYPIAESSDGAAYLAAQILGDPRYIWLAGRALEGRAATIGYTGAQPGVEGPSDMVGHAPTTGSCLVYGDSGMPNQPGPLAPDKIIFRDGWEPGSAYAMLNLRFTGWHRYKASNTLTLAYQAGPLVADQLEGRTFNWLPVGRRFFRDKRIPRENLSGLLVARSGMSDLIGQLTGGGPWAQDPPFYAGVEQFSTGLEYDSSTTTLSGWRGWSQRRTIRFYHGGPLVVYDQADGPAGVPAAIAWSLPGAAPLAGKRIALRDGPDPAEMVFVGAGALQDEAQESGGRRVLALPAQAGHLTLVSVLLTSGWAGADVQLDSADANLLITSGAQRIIVPLDGR